MKTEKNTYEISFLARSEEGAGTVLKHLNQVGAEIAGQQRIEQVNPAYPIKKHSSAHFGCIQFALQGEEIKTLKDILRFEESILRYIIVTPPFVREENPQLRGPRGSQEVPSEKQSGVDTIASNRDLEAKLEEISGSFEGEG